MLNKKSLFRWLCVSGAIAIFTYVSSGVVAKESLHDFRSELNQIYWRGRCAEREVIIKYNEKYKDDQWILKEKYKDSRSKVIGEAIGDCVAGKNEFANKKPEDIITFEGTSPENYEQKHWNAVILYNYVHEAINGERAGKEEKHRLLGWQNKKSKIEQYYKDYYTNSNIQNKNNLINELNGKLERAIKIIQKYSKILQLKREMLEFRKSMQQYDPNKSFDNIAPMTYETSYNAAWRGVTAHLYDYPSSNTNLRFLYQPDFFVLHDGNLYITNFVIHKQTYISKEEIYSTYYTKGDLLPVYVRNHDGLYGNNKSAAWLRSLLEGLVKLPDYNQWNKFCEDIYSMEGEDYEENI